jgi:hypothetical protein
VIEKQQILFLKLLSLRKVLGATIAKAVKLRGIYLYIVLKTLVVLSEAHSTQFFLK